MSKKDAKNWCVVVGTRNEYEETTVDRIARHGLTYDEAIWATREVIVEAQPIVDTRWKQPNRQLPRLVAGTLVVEVLPDVTMGLPLPDPDGHDREIIGRYLLGHLKPATLVALVGELAETATGDAGTEALQHVLWALVEGHGWATARGMLGALGYLIPVPWEWSQDGKRVYSGVN